MTALREAAQQALEALECGQHTLKQVSENQWESLGQLAIEALRAALENEFNPDWDQVEALQESLREHMVEIHRLRAALAEHYCDTHCTWADHAPGCDKAEPVQEPVAWIQPNHLQKARRAPFLCRVEPTKRMVDFVALYTAPPQRKPLTEEEMLNIIDDMLEGGSLVDVARAIERAHGIGGSDE